MFKYFKRMMFIFKFKKFIPFLREFFRSKEVKLYKKVVAVSLMLVYAFLPFDLIPDFLLLFGIIDDFAIITFILTRIIKMAPHSLKEKYNLLD